MLRTTCPECGEPIEFDEDAQVGDRVVCDECRVELEIVGLSPLTVDYALVDDWEETWDRDEELDDDVRWDDD